MAENAESEEEEEEEDEDGVALGNVSMKKSEKTTQVENA